MATATADLVLEDKHAQAHSACIPGSTYDIVTARPNGIIGAIVQDRRWLQEHFLGYFGAERENPSASILSSTSR
jgi:hypothetical protein